ncbi:hypothetical protein SBF1_7360002 [Candidatus Desulfosporosinus infrequens]|uniref:Uncharacterized protein n=1 Tax=Candidatus Desulfosporosinus infrequens TaxID=2043169 RepID=A0A2U3LQA3_9FIRM|nr:hypothetical protein SBF1_7360002 [Candidatus Desulfosporosinus infrequens]
MYGLQFFNTKMPVGVVVTCKTRGQLVCHEGRFINQATELIGLCRF